MAKENKKEKKPVSEAEKKHSDVKQQKQKDQQEQQVQQEQQEQQEQQVQQEQQEQKPSLLKDLMSISGYSGLFRFISQARNGIIVESLETGRRMNAFATMKVSSLEDISVFAENEEVSLEEIMLKIKEKEAGGQAISHKSSPEQLKEFFSNILPEYDRDRVYVSDIKKIVNWYNILQQHDLLKEEEQLPQS